MKSHRAHERGAIAVIAALLLVALIGFAALAVDVPHLAVARNELQNAADAGALAGARFLYRTDPDTHLSMVDTGSNEIARSAAVANRADTAVVEVNEADVQRGHWSFATKTFTPNDSTELVDLWNVPTSVLDADPNFINALKVTARRQATPALSFFARIFGSLGFEMSADAVAYIGFAGTLNPGEADQPIAICRTAITGGDGTYSCAVGHMMPATTDTAAWTNFEQPDTCTGAASTPTIRPLICSGGNPLPIVYGRDMETNNGTITSALSDFWECWWEASAHGTKPWQLTLPVIDCPDGTIGPCQRLVGAVTVMVVWVLDGTAGSSDPDPATNPSQKIHAGAPVTMAGFGEGSGEYESWSSTSTDGPTRWADFAHHFNLPSDWNQKTIYYVPDCSPHEPSGTTGGENFGVLAKIPVLVE